MSSREKSTTEVSRRGLIAGALTAGAAMLPTVAAAVTEKSKATNGRIKQSVVFWCFNVAATNGMPIKHAK